jgi:lytic murein transglycosylase
MRKIVLAAALWAAFAAPALAAQCEPQGGFPVFIAAIHREAAAQGVGTRGLAALDGLTLDRSVIARDHHQGVFRQSFEQFSGRMISRDRMVRGERYLHTMAATFRRIEERYGVPPGVLVAIWAMETDFGVNQGHFSVLRSVATLAYDCRRSQKFQEELLAGLQIVDRGMLSSSQLQGDWAGEIGQTQFLPSSLLKYGVDFDGNGHIDLAHSAADSLASTANYLKGHGWQRGAGWQPGQPNFDVIKTWNKADVYARTIALFGERLEERRGASAR